MANSTHASTAYTRIHLSHEPVLVHARLLMTLIPEESHSLDCKPDERLHMWGTACTNTLNTMHCTVSVFVCVCACVWVCARACVAGYSPHPILLQLR